MDLITEKFGAQEVAAATGTTPKQITDWCNQGHIFGQKEPLGKGRRREFTFRNVMQIAGAVELMQVGVTAPGDAFRAAAYFAHIESEHSEVGGKENPPLPVRKASFPYHFEDGETFLAVSGRQGSVVLSKAGEINVRRIFPLHRKPVGLILLDVTEVFKTVIARMDTGSNWAQILNEVYGR